LKDSQVRSRDSASSLRELRVDSELTLAARGLLNVAEQAQAEQIALVESFPLASQYEAVFTAQVEAKHAQVERIEDRLESLIERQDSVLQQLNASQPGFISLPASRVRWQQQVQQKTNTVNLLRGRLETVREIKDGMGIHSPRIEEMAARKVRAQNPELAESWDEMQEAGRRHQAHWRKKAQDQKQAQSQREKEQPGRGHRMGLSQSR
jgi:hypothetical protein